MTPLSHFRSALCKPLFCSAMLLAAASVQVAVSLDHANQERGAADFRARGCVRCHSITGVGGDRAPDLGRVGLRRSPRQIRTQIIKGGHGMPPFGKTLSAAEVDDLVAFLSSCHTDDAPGCRTWSDSESK
jgi:mono/diheme cytochrome c family protein